MPGYQTFAPLSLWFRHKHWQSPQIKPHQNNKNAGTLFVYFLAFMNTNWHGLDLLHLGVSFPESFQSTLHRHHEDSANEQVAHGGPTESQREYKYKLLQIVQLPVLFVPFSLSLSPPIPSLVPSPSLAPLPRSTA